jgi:hypothetical protein
MRCFTCRLGFGKHRADTSTETLECLTGPEDNNLVTGETLRSAAAWLESWHLQRWHFGYLHSLSGCDSQGSGVGGRTAATRWALVLPHVNGIFWRKLKAHVSR